MDGSDHAGRRIVLVSPHGFCAGVERAISMAEGLVSRGRQPVYCLHQLVHNAEVIERLGRQGMVFVSDVQDVPAGATLLFSAHGVAPAVRAAAAARGLRIVDATCPFVAKVHAEVRRAAATGETVLLIGHRRHEEVIGVAGEAPERVQVIETPEEAAAVAVPDPGAVTVVSQTTLAPADTERVIATLRSRFPRLRAPAESDICYATRNRQLAVKRFAAEADFFIVLGSANSSNSNRLVEVARSEGCPAALVSRLDQLGGLPLEHVRVLGLTAGASTPEPTVEAAIERLRPLGFQSVESRAGVTEDIHFALPQL